MNVTFDWNEWFMIISAVIPFSLFFLIRKYFHIVIIIVIWMFTNVYVASIDYFLLASPFKLYYFGDNPSYEASGALFHLVFYPCGSLLFLYVYDKLKLYGLRTAVYILLWGGLGVFYEWLCLKNNVLIYTGWELKYSIFTYIPSAVLLLLLFHFTKRKLREFKTR